ncbi:MAG: heparinase II/III family protein [Phycisphaerae bacterium]|nr:heparinase II/III family protein [Phycisphaerae bacterium]
MMKTKLIVLMLLFAGIFCFCNCAPVAAKVAVKKPAKKKAAKKPAKRKYKFIKPLPWKGDILSTLRKGHPRLLFTTDDEKRIKELAKTNELLAELINQVTKNAERMLTEPVIVFKRNSRKRVVYLGSSRTALARITTLAMAYRMTGDKRFAERARKEMMAGVEHGVTHKNWNPSHFLDLAELCCGMAIGYDWLYDTLSEKDRATIRKAIVEKALKPGLKAYDGRGYSPGWWLQRSNWNQVCNAGLLLGALAVADEEPEIARKTVRYAINSIPYGMTHYAPDGAYREGVPYWRYGTSFNVMFINALETALGSDFGLCKTEGFEKTGFFLLQMIGPFGQSFNFADTGGSGFGAAHAMFWLGKKFNKPGYSWYNRTYLEKAFAGCKKSGKTYKQYYFGSGRFFPLAVAWFDDRAKAPTALASFFGGYVHMAAIRSSWDKNAIYLAFKGGNNQAGHAHLDIGSFVLDADGVRWAADLGADQYKLPGYFNRRKQRWNYYRTSTRSHNTLVIGNKNQNDKDSVSEIIKSLSTPSRVHAVVDMTNAYRGQAKKVRRGVAMLDRNAILIQDEITAPVDDVRWGMLTHAKIKLDGAKAILTRGGKTLSAEILEPAGAKFEIVSTTPPTEKEKQNKGTRMLATTIKPGKSKRVRIVILLKPVGENWKETPTPKIKPLANWKGKKLK